MGGTPVMGGAERGMLGILVNVMICGSFGFDRSRGFRGAVGPFQRIAIIQWTGPCNSAKRYCANT